MWCPSIQQVLLFHSKLITRTGGSTGIRSLPLIENALNRFYASFDGKDLYSSSAEKQRLSHAD